MESTLELVGRLMEEEKQTKQAKKKINLAEKKGRHLVQKDDDDYFRINPRAAARERSIRRHLSDAGLQDVDDDAAAEVSYDANFNFFRDGIQIEPYNTKEEMKQGYLDYKGDFVPFDVDNNEDDHEQKEQKEKDPWVRSLYEDDATGSSKYYRKKSTPTTSASASSSSSDKVVEDVATISRRIANVLEGEETVSHALRRLKRNSGGKGKMTNEATALFDQLTDDATNLIQYYGEGCKVYSLKKDRFSEEAKRFEDSLLISVKQQPCSETEGLALQSDCEFDPSSGYYYHSSSGHYYDPCTGLYCHAGTGQWYSYDDQTGGYKAV